MTYDSHWYNHNGDLVAPGTGFPSPTTILEVRRNKGLEAWKEREPDWQQIVKDAQDRGTEAHRRVELFLKTGQFPEEVDEISPLFQGFMNWYEKYQPTKCSPEVFLLNRTHGYAGRSDLLCEIDGEWWIIDFKTSKSFHEGMGLQLVSYAKAAEDMFGIKVRHAGIVQLTNEIKRGYRFREYDDSFNVFLAHLEIFKWEMEKNPPKVLWSGGLIYG